MCPKLTRGANSLPWSFLLSRGEGEARRGPPGPGRDGGWEGFQPVLLTQLFQMQLDEACLGAENLLPLSHPCAASVGPALCRVLCIHDLSSSSTGPSPHRPTLWAHPHFNPGVNCPRRASCLWWDTCHFLLDFTQRNPHLTQVLPSTTGGSSLP